MATQAGFFGQQPPPPITKGNTPSSTTTESSSSKTKNGIKTITTKYVTTTREPTSDPDMNTNTINKETRTYNDGTADDITLTRKVLGGMQYDIETIIRTQTKDVGKKNTKTTYSTSYQELDPVTGKPINAFKPAAHSGPDHAKAPAELAAQIAQRAPAVSNQSHNVTPVTTGPGSPPVAAPAPPPPAAVSAASGGSASVSYGTPGGGGAPGAGGAPGGSGAPGGAPGYSGGTPSAGGTPGAGGAPTGGAAPAAPAPATTTTTTTTSAPGGAAGM